MKYIFQSMQWSKLCWNLSWNERISLKAIVPQIGESYPIELAWNEDHIQTGFVEFLWQPPHSELNGWEDRPTEILKSFIISGNFEASTKAGENFRFTVSSRLPLLKAFEGQKQESEFKLPECGLENGGSYVLWERARNICSSRIEQYIYISGAECETTLEAILEISESNKFLVYHAYLPPARYETVITRKLLSGKELEVIDQILENASKLVDQTEVDLSNNEIQGAKYY